MSGEQEEKVDSRHSTCKSSKEEKQAYFQELKIVGIVIVLH